MRNHEVTKRQPLLKADGSLAEPGWAKQLVWEYNRSNIKAPKFRIKEWDYYLVLNDDFAGAFTISDDGYVGLQSVSLLNFKEGWEHTETILNAFPMGKLKLPATSETGDTVYQDKRLKLEYRVTEGQRRIICEFKDFWQGKPFFCDITLQQPDMDTMVMAQVVIESPVAVAGGRQRDRIKRRCIKCNHRNQNYCHYKRCARH